MQTSILGVLPWREAQNSQYIVALRGAAVRERAPAAFATVMILWIAFASLFATLLSYSRVPFAAAEDAISFRYLRVCIHKNISARLVALSRGRVADVQRIIPSFQCD